tara:strand:- start:767 stop:1279 length:513 start_codon:yes stop_codon:yes gene_type:complete
MNHEIAYLHCDEHLKRSLKNEIDEVLSVVAGIEWQPIYKHVRAARPHQTSYNMRFKDEFKKLGWKTQPRLSDKLRLIGDFGKNRVFGEVQFGTSPTLYRDFYKFQYGHRHRLFDLGVLITPVNPNEFFPRRDDETGNSNMAEYKLALRYFRIIQISVPTMVIDLKADSPD